MNFSLMELAYAFGIFILMVVAMSIVMMVVTCVNDYFRIKIGLIDLKQDFPLILNALLLIEKKQLEAMVSKNDQNCEVMTFSIPIEKMEEEVNLIVTKRLNTENIETGIDCLDFDFDFEYKSLNCTENSKRYNGNFYEILLGSKEHKEALRYLHKKSMKTSEIKKQEVKILAEEFT